MLIGLITGIVIMLILFLCAFIGYKLGQKQKVEKMTEEQAYKLKLRNEGIQNIMEYDYSKALGR